jgi:hypothetical protein
MPVDAAGGTMDAEQLDALGHLLRKDRDRPTLLFGHHPVTYESAATTEAGPTFGIDRPTAIALQRLYEQAPGVFFPPTAATLIATSGRSCSTTSRPRWSRWNSSR